MLHCTVMYNQKLLRSPKNVLLIDYNYPYRIERCMIINTKLFNQVLFLSFQLSTCTIDQLPFELIVYQNVEFLLFIYLSGNFLMVLPKLVTREMVLFPMWPSLKTDSVKYHPLCSYRCKQMFSLLPISSSLTYLSPFFVNLSHFLSFSFSLSIHG